MKMLIKKGAFGASLVLVLAAAFPVGAWAQLTDPSSGEDGMRGAPRIYKYSARTVGLADATVAESQDISIMNINPAGLAFIRDLKSIQINVFQNWNNNMMMENITFPVVAYNGFTAAAQFSFYHGGFEQTNYLQQIPMPQPNLMMTQFDIAYAYTFNNVLSLGMLNNFSYAQNEFAQYWTYYPTFGLLYAPSLSVTYGLAFRGLGRSITYIFPGQGRTALGSQNLRESLEIGATLKFPVETDNTYLSISLANEKRFGENGLWYKAGIEVKRIEHLALRAGLIFRPENNVYAPRFGIGLISRLVELDYAISYEERYFERFHQLGITFHLDQLNR